MKKILLGLGTFAAIVAPITTTVATSCDSIKSTFTQAFEDVKGYWNDHKDDIKNAFDKLGTEGKAIFTKLIHSGEDVIDKAKTWFNKTGEDTKNAFRAGFDKVKATADGVIKSVETGFEEAKSKIKGAIDELLDNDTKVALNEQLDKTKTKDDLEGFAGYVDVVDKAAQTK